MFDSLSGGYLPICVLVLGFAWLIAKVKNVVARALLTVASPLMVSFAWFFMPRMFRLFRPLDPGEDSWVGWGIMASTSWSIAAVPLSIVAVYIFVLRFKKNNL